MSEHYPFELNPLPYSYDALEPYIDSKTVEIHHDRHLKTYVENLNKTLKDYPQYHSWSIEKLILQNQILPKKIQKAVFNNAGGIYNHNFYFDMLSPDDSDMSNGFLLKAIIKTYGSFEKFKEEFKEAALSVFGSGYAWLLTDHNGYLKIITTANQETDLNQRGCKLLNIDVWEHAYYLKYLNKRVDYVNNIFYLFNWRKAEQLYLDCLSCIN